MESYSVVLSLPKGLLTFLMNSSTFFPFLTELLTQEKPTAAENYIGTGVTGKNTLKSWLSYHY